MTPGIPEPQPAGTDWTAPDSPAPLTDDEQAEAELQWRQRAQEIRGPQAETDG